MINRHENGGEFEESNRFIATNSKLRQYWGDEEVLPTLENISRVHPPIKFATSSQATKQTTHLRDFMLQTPTRFNEFDFSKCRMSNCFDYSRCNTSGPIKVHILPPNSAQNTDFLNLTGESNIIHNNILKIIRESKYHETDPSKACLFMLSDDSLDRDPLSKSFRSGLPDLLRPEYHFGMNHLVINLYSGSWPDYSENDFSGFNIGAAILAKASNSITYHRPNFDISIPLFSYLHPTHNEEFTSNKSRNENRNRSYFLTFKGKRYVTGGGSDTRNSLYHLNNQNDVIMLTTCRHGKRWREASDLRCEKDDSAYDQYDFDDLMQNSVFCLTPRGRRLGSFRFLEALSYDCIPVVLSDSWVWPFGEIIDWSRVAIQFNEDLIFHVPDLLRDIEPPVIAAMQRNCRAHYQEYFSTTEKIVMTALSIVEKRIKNQLG